LKKILFTGGSSLLASNWGISIADRYEVLFSLHKKQISVNNIKFVKLNLSSYDELCLDLSLIKPDVLINCIGYTNIEQCELHPNLAFETNSDVPSMLAIVCKKLGIKFVHISTDHLYDGRSSMMSEVDKLFNFNIYGQSKIDAEKRVQEKNDNALIIRTNFFGWGTSYRKSFSDFIIENLRKKNKINLFKNVYFTPILIQDLANVVSQLIEYNKAGIFNVVCDERVSKLDFGLKIAKIFNLDSNLIVSINFSDMKNLVDRPLDLSLSNAKLCNILGRNIGNVDEQICKLFSEENTINHLLIKSL